MQRKADPDRCVWGACPFEAFLEDETLAEVYRFCAFTIEHYPQKDAKSGTVKRHHYSVSIERFDLACRLFQVPKDKELEAFEWCALVATAAADAQDVGIQRMREQVRRVARERQEG